MIMRIMRSVLLSASLLCFSSAFATSTIISTNSFTTVQNLLKQAKNPHQVLLAMDDDDTLTMMPCPNKNQCQYLGGPAWYKWQSNLPATSSDRVWKNFSQLLNISNALFILNNMPLTDPAIIPALKTADKRGAATMVITDRGYRMISATDLQLSHDDILNLVEKNAIKTPSGHTSFPGFYFPTPWNNNKPRHIAYVHGVMYDAGQNKGVMIQQFLAKTNATQSIHEIIFIDDTMKNVQDVAAAYKNDPTVHVIAIHFTRLSAHKAAFLTGKHATQLQALANKQWFAIRDALRKNLLGYSL